MTTPPAARQPEDADALAADAAVLRRFRQEHESMRRHFDAVQASLASLHSAQQTPHLLRNLAQAVRNHFEMEEVDGIYEQVQRDAPHLASEVHKLEADHQVLLEEIAELADMGQGLVDDAWVRQVSHLFRRFRDRMAHHEAEENKVVQRAYSDDVGTKD